MQRRNLVKNSLVLALAGGALATSAAAQATLDTELVASGLNGPVWAGAPAGDNRIFVLEQNTADVEVYENGVKLGTFLDLTGKVLTAGNERGLLALAFHPDYATNGHFFVYYTASGVGSRIERYTVSASNPNVADASSAQTILEHPQFQSNHNGGALHFGPDGYLYFAYGDGGGAGDTSCNAQKLGNLYGAMIRIDVDSGLPYTIPADNPFVGVAGARGEIFHYGLRNPWRWSFDALTGDFYIGDVGQGAREEITVAPAGASGVNHGWKVMEGFNCFGSSNCPAGTPACNSPALLDPIHDYSHAFGCSVTGGYVYRGCEMPDYDGVYIFSDYCSGRTWMLTHDVGTGTTSPVTDISAQIGSFSGINQQTSYGEDGFGEMLVVDQGGQVYRIIAGDSLSADVDVLSVSAGGTQNMSLHAGKENGGNLYFLAGSITGTAGIPVGGITIPLTLDNYTLNNVNNPNSIPLLNNFGTLDPCGTAAAQFTATPGLLPISLIGTTAFHAYGVFDGGFSGTFASNFIGLTFDV